MTTSRRPASQGQQAALHDRPLFLVIDGHAVVHRAWEWWCPSLSPPVFALAAKSYLPSSAC
ncbi:MAG: hypothetical protein O7F09_04440 [Chloroflexi bacterium]|nr:hypothetical protein [Chloroflexota bacterium]